MAKDERHDCRGRTATTICKHPSHTELVATAQNTGIPGKTGDSMNKNNRAKSDTIVLQQTKWIPSNDNQTAFGKATVKVYLAEDVERERAEFEKKLEKEIDRTDEYIAELAAAEARVKFLESSVKKLIDIKNKNEARVADLDESNFEPKMSAKNLSW